MASLFDEGFYWARRAPLEAVQGVAVEAVVPLFRAAVEAAEGALLRMHGQDFGGDAAPDIAAPSPYMAELARQLSHFRHALVSAS